MGGVCRFVVPGPPKGKAVARVTTRGTFIPAATRKEMDAARLIARMAMGNRPPFTGPVDLKLCAYFAVPQSWSRVKRVAALAGTIRPTPKPDLSNVIKGIEDAIVTKRARPGKPNFAPLDAVIRDDSQIVKITAWKMYAEDPRVVAVVEEIDL
jgi:Holliday junction resolvase RusA-like endonuclease